MAQPGRVRWACDVGSSWVVYDDSVSDIIEQGLDLVIDNKTLGPGRAARWGIDAAHPGALARERDALAVEGSLSRQMTQTLETHGAHSALRSALDAIGKRLEKS